MTKYRPLQQLLWTRMLQFFREPEAIFWTYGFPLLMVVGLGIAFRNKPPEAIRFDVVASSETDILLDAFAGNENLQARPTEREQALIELKNNKTPLVVMRNDEDLIEYHYDPTNPDGLRARNAVNNALQRAAGRTDVLQTQDIEQSAPGSRYIDWLVPGLIGMNLMGGGMWGIGFVLVDMRVRNLLKRLLATPMKRSDFLLSMVGGRALFFIPEMLFLLVGAYLIFHVPIRGNLLSVIAIAFVGAIAFAGLGLLTACRAQRIETISGLMNLVMLPMWLMSGIFFSSENFPSFLQPFIKALPLTQLNDALRSVILDGDPLLSQWSPLAILALWGAVSYFLALRWFRWS